MGSSLTITVLPLILLNIESDFSISHGLAGALVTILMTASGVGRFFEGIIVDRNGKVPAILMSGSLFVIGTAGLGFSVNYLMACLFIFIIGLGNGLYSPVGFSLVSHIFSDHRGKMVGFYDSIFPLSALVAYAAKGFGNYLGDWRFSIFLIGAIVLISFSTLLTYTRSRIPAYLKPFTEKKLSIYDYIKRVKYEVTHSAVFIHITILIIPVSIVINGLMHFLPSYLVQSRGLTGNFAGVLYMLFMGVSVLGKVSSGWFVDEYSTRSSLLIYAAIGVIGLALLTLSPTFVILILGIVVLAPSRGGVFTLMHAHLLGKLPDSSRDLLYGFFMVMLMTAGSAGPLMVGLLIDSFNFFVAFLALTVIFMLSLPITYFLICDE